MKISARIHNSPGRHQAGVQTGETARTLAIPPKEGGPGSSVNGGELLFLALATCYGNDIYREAARLGIRVTEVEVEVSGDFGSPGEAARNVTYRARVQADADAQTIRNLLLHTDKVAEIQNTVREGTAVTLILDD